MPENINVRWGWLKFMYIYTVVGAGGFGLAMIVVPEVIRSMFRWPVEEPIALGIWSRFLSPTSWPSNQVRAINRFIGEEEISSGCRLPSGWRGR